LQLIWRFNMARNDNPVQADAVSASAAGMKSGDGQALSRDSVELFRGLMGRAMQGANGLIAWMEQVHQLESKFMGASGQAIELALREVQQADDAQSLMAVPAKLVNRQLALGMQLFGAGVSQWIEHEMRLSESIQKDMLDLAKRSLRDSARPALDGNGGDASALLQIGRLQDQWLALSQRWIDAAGSLNPAAAAAARHH
jgi:hypothetical protein